MKIFKEAERCVPGPYCLHEKKLVSDAAQHGFVEYFYPKDGLTSDVLEFNVEGNDTQLIHPYTTYIKIKGKLEGSEVTAAATDAAKTVANGEARVGFVNNILGSIFESVDVELNNVNITKSDRNYPYVAYLDQLLNYGEEAKKTSMQLIGWSTDTAGNMETIGDTNEGYKKRRAFLNTKKEIELIGKLCSPLFNQGKFLPMMVSMRVTVKKGRERFFLMHEDGEFSFKLSEAILMVQKTVPVPGMISGYMKMMEEGKPCVLNLRHARVNHISIPQSMTEKTIDNLFLGKVPERVIIGLVETDAYIGKRNRNPFNFQHFDIAEIGLYKDGSAYPRPLIKMNVDEGQWAEAYHHFLTSIRARNNRLVPGISASDYQNGFTLFSYDMSPDQLGTMHPGSVLNMNSNIRLELKFHKALPKGVTIIVYYEYSRKVEIHRDRQIVAEE